MELNERLLGEIAGIFRGVQYGKVTFFISPERKTLDCSVEISHKLPIEKKEKIMLDRTGAKA